MSPFRIWNVQSAVTSKSGRVPSRKSVFFFFGISKHMLYFPYCFHVPETVVFTVYFQTVLPCFAFSVIDCTWKQTLLIKRFNFVFIKDLPSVSQSNVQAVTAKNEEQPTLSNIIYNKFQNCSFFLWGLIWRRCS